MENSSYLPNSLVSPGLMVLASAAGEAGGDTLSPHIQNSKIHHTTPGNNDTESLAVTPQYTASYPLYHTGREQFPAPVYPPPPVHNQFIRPSPSHGMINPGGGGAFRPVGNMDSNEGSYQSAFLPTKRSKVEASSSVTVTTTTNHANSTQSSDSSKSATRSGVEKDEGVNAGDNVCEQSREIAETEDTETVDEQDGHNLRRLRKKSVLDGQTSCCPVCGVTVRSGEMGTHLTLELDRLDKINRNSKKNIARESASQSKKNLCSPSTSRKGRESPTPPREGTSQLSRYDTYQRVKGNRQLRLNAKRGSRRRRNQTDTMCPICSEKLSGTAEELNEHVEQCLKKRSENEEEESVDIEGEDDQYEEYTWAGQTRIRVTSMLQGGYAASGFKTGEKDEDEEGDLNVDGDDEEMYGSPQYNEADIIPCTSDEPSEERERRALRGAYLQAEGSSPQEIEATKWITSPDEDSGDNCIEGDQREKKSDEAEQTSVNTLTGESANLHEIIDSLRAKIKEQDEILKKSERLKCLICMESYTKPLTSIQCWHVHCEECWLRTLGAKKLCPQCNSITSPTDLRKIYL